MEGKARDASHLISWPLTRPAVFRPQAHRPAMGFAGRGGSSCAGRALDAAHEARVAGGVASNAARGLVFHQDSLCVQIPH